MAADVFSDNETPGPAQCSHLMYANFPRSFRASPIVGSAPVTLGRIDLSY